MEDFTDSIVEVEGVQVGVHEHVSPGPTFVLVHGLGVSAAYFEPLAEDLLGRGRVLALDLPGSGETATPRRRLTIPDFARVLRAALVKLDARDAVLLGHSMGTQVVAEALIQEPGLARGAMLAAPVVNAAEHSTPRVMFRFTQSALREPLPSMWASIKGYLSCGPRWLSTTMRSMMEYRLEAHVGRIDCPVVVVGGEHDTISPPSWVKQVADAAPSGTPAVIVPGAAHQTIFTDPEDLHPHLFRLAEVPA